MRFPNSLVPAMVLMHLISVAVTAGEPSRSSPRGESLELLFDAAAMPMRLELQVEIDGRPLAAIWDESFAQLTAYVDRDRNGSLDQAEASRLPPAFELRQLLWGKVASINGSSPPFAELDLDEDGKVSCREVGDWYHRAGLGGAVVGIGKAPATEQLTTALLRLVDNNHDGWTDEAEWKEAATTLAAHDANDDELIGPGELVPRITYPGTLGTFFLKSPAAGPMSLIADSLPFVVLPWRLDDLDWVTSVAGRRQRANLPAVTLETLTELRQAPPAVGWHIHFGGNAASGVTPPRLEWNDSHTRLHLRLDNGKLGEQFAAAQARLTALFSDVDSNSDQLVEDGELHAPTAASIKALLPIADRNDDAKLSRNELEAWLNLQGQLVRGQILLTILDHGTGLFELLDSDHDGALSVRELRTSWKRLLGSGCVESGRLEVRNLPRQLLATISHGQPTTLIVRQTHGAPPWFSAMDRNGDGDLSPGEFTGGREVFDRLDADDDGLLSSEEAAKVGAARLNPSSR